MPPAAKKKVVVIGFDSMIIPLARKFIAMGKMPHLQQLIARGTLTPALPSIPCWTPTNWATIATGCDTATHEIVRWDFNGRHCQAEFVWATAEKQGKRSILLGYPTGWPPTLKQGVIFEAGKDADLGIIAKAGCFSTKQELSFKGGLHGDFNSVPLRLRRASGWKKYPLPWTEVKECSLPLIRGFGDNRIIKHYHVLIPKELGRYTRIFICRQKDPGTAMAELRAGEWSRHIDEAVPMDGKMKHGKFRFRLADISPTTGDFSLYRGHIYSLAERIYYPRAIGPELVKVCGEYEPDPGAYLLGPLWFKVYEEALAYHIQWLSKAAVHLMRTSDWDLLFIKNHSPDTVQHYLWQYFDPSHPQHDPAYYRPALATIARTYQLLDGLIGTISRQISPQTLMAVVSDHGHVPISRSILMANLLADMNLLRPNTNPCRPTTYGLDWKKTKVFLSLIDIHIPHDRLQMERCYGSTTVRRFLKEGLRLAVPREYACIRDRIIRRLRSIRDPETGCYPFALVLPADEADFLGLPRRCIGDIVFLLQPGYSLSREYNHVYRGRSFIVPCSGGVFGNCSSEHSQTYPSAHGGPYGTINAILAIAGPDVRRGYCRTHPVHLQDLVPTLCHWLGISPSRQVTGSIIYDIFNQKKE